MRLIDADESINRIVKIRPINPKQSDYSHGVDVGLAMAMVAIEEQPTIDTVRNGKWILVKGSNGKDYHKCSECLHTQEITGVKNYCAVCGADMGEGD